MVIWRVLEIYISALMVFIHHTDCVHMITVQNQELRDDACTGGDRDGTRRVEIYSLLYGYQKPNAPFQCAKFLRGEYGNDSIQDDKIFEQCSGKRGCEVKLSDDIDDLPRLQDENCINVGPNLISMTYSCINGNKFCEIFIAQIKISVCKDTSIMDMCGDETKTDLTSLDLAYFPDRSPSVTNCTCVVSSHTPIMHFNLTAVDVVLKPKCDNDYKCSPISELKMLLKFETDVVLSENYTNYSRVNAPNIYQNLTFANLQLFFNTYCQQKPRNIWWRVNDAESSNFSVTCKSYSTWEAPVISSPPCPIGSTDTENNGVTGSSNRGHFTMGALVGCLAAGVFLLIITIIVIIIFLRRRKRRKKSTDNTNLESLSAGHPSSDTVPDKQNSEAYELVADPDPSIIQYAVDPQRRTSETTKTYIVFGNESQYLHKDMNMYDHVDAQDPVYDHLKGTSLNVSSEANETDGTQYNTLHRAIGNSPVLNPESNPGYELATLNVDPNGTGTKLNYLLWQIS